MDKTDSKPRINAIKVGNYDDNNNTYDLKDGETECDDDGIDYNYSIRDESADLPTVDVKVCNSEIEVLIDTGSTINVIDSNTFKSWTNRPKLNKYIRKVSGYNSRVALNW